MESLLLKVILNVFCQKEGVMTHILLQFVEFKRALEVFWQIVKSYQPLHFLNKAKSRKTTLLHQKALKSASFFETLKN